jgi:hypothetical protein
MKMGHDPESQWPCNAIESTSCQAKDKNICQNEITEERRDSRRPSPFSSDVPVETHRKANGLPNLFVIAKNKARKARVILE